MIPAIIGILASRSVAAPIDTFFSSVSLLLHGEALVDSSGTPKTIDASTGVVSSTEKKFGTSSLFYTSSYTNVVSNAQLDMSNGDFTIEAWVRTTGTGGSQGCIISANDGGYRAYVVVTSAGALAIGGNAFPDFSTAGGVVVPNTWHHVAAVREGEVGRLYVDGVLLSTQTGISVANTFNLSAGSTLVGSGNVGFGTVPPTSTQGSFSGYIDELRVTKGVARYSANFTPPTAAFPNS
jgi:Concanavalin A-like lectin/glucanases superfamily